MIIFALAVLKLFQEQEAILRNCYEKVIKKFGKDNLISLLKLIKQMDGLMCSEIKEMGEGESYGRDDESDE